MKRPKSTYSLGVLCVSLSCAWRSSAALPPQTFSAAALAQTVPMSVPPSAVETPITPRGTDKPADPVPLRESRSSTYIPADSWMYPALQRLQALGYLETGFLGLRPWTRLSVVHMLQTSSDEIKAGKGAANDEAREIFVAMETELFRDDSEYNAHAEPDTVYTRFEGIAHTPLRDSYHLGQTVYNDYGRPYEAGVNNVSGASGRAESGRFSLYVRGEYQGAPSALGYNAALFTYLSWQVDLIPVASNPVQDTIPLGPIPATNVFRLLEAYASYHISGHEVSFGKKDHWLGPGAGGSFAWSNNADNTYSFEINRVEPLHVPLLSRLTGPFRYDFFVGSLQGHTAPNAPWVHMEKVSFKPTRNLEMGFERTVIWGGKDHEPITLHTFLRSFVSVQGVSAQEKFSRLDPGARFSSFDFSYRLPLVRNWLTLYTDSFAHDDVNPISAPRRAAIRPGIYLSHVPKLPHLDLRVEGVETDPPTARSVNGTFLEYEAVQKQGTTNKGFLFGDAVGREDKGGQAWVTYHLSANEQIQLSYRNVKAAKDFIEGGTTQNQFKVDAVKRISKDVELNAWIQYERWKAPVYRAGGNGDTAVAAQITWYPQKTKVF
jgi:Capsule assembly protein Wzi